MSSGATTPPITSFFPANRKRRKVNKLPEAPAVLIIHAKGPGAYIVKNLRKEILECIKKADGTTYLISEGIYNNDFFSHIKSDASKEAVRIKLEEMVRRKCVPHNELESGMQFQFTLRVQDD